jgi:hypothetical protein
MGLPGMGQPASPQQPVLICWAPTQQEWYGPGMQPQEMHWVPVDSPGISLANLADQPPSPDRPMQMPQGQMMQLPMPMGMPMQQMGGQMQQMPMGGQMPLQQMAMQQMPMQQMPMQQMPMGGQMPLPEKMPMGAQMPPQVWSGPEPVPYSVQGCRAVHQDFQAVEAGSQDGSTVASTGDFPSGSYGASSWRA